MIDTASDAANAALLKATLALDRIARHEETCGRRWAMVMKLMWVLVMKMAVLLGVLLADKVGVLHDI
ncbi:hypothetical protein GCM10017044_11000 [Kordiimonas sediminis]|uniref:Uncharacterized protein n=1 Tax=Kordiimonas sediminis TaxID=1735581 RepID=A0A919AQ91_9PROT|nr:hypothetical protein [Kordiimonas sediminis]GHF18286.1 hypothetical protein GCM10017044_11000 [Kordiimonas sediminis]